MSNFTEAVTKNRRLFIRGIKQFIDKQVEPAIEDMFRYVSNMVDRWLETQTSYQNQTYNLTDSIGVGTYKHGTLVNWHQPRMALGQTRNLWVSRGTVIPINGFQLLQAAISEGEGSSFAEYTLVVYAAVPYAEWVELSLGAGGSNKRGKHWWSAGLIPYVQKEFADIVAAGQGNYGYYLTSSSTPLSGWGTDWGMFD